MLFRPKHIEHEVDFGDGPRPVRFYPVSTAKLFTFKDVARDIGTVVAGLFERPTEVAKRTVRDVEDQGVAVKEHVFEPPTGEAIRAAMAARERCIEKAADVLMSRQSLLCMAELVQDSARDEAEIRSLTPAKLIEECPVDVFPQLVQGVLLANKRVLDPLVGRLREASKALTEKVERKLKELGTGEVQADGAT